MNSALAHAINRSLAYILRGGIRYRLFLLVGLIVLPFAALLTFIFYERYESRRAHALTSEFEVAHGLAVTFTAYLAGIRKHSLSVGYAVASLGPARKERTTALLTSAVHSSPGVRSISWLSPHGVVLASSDPPLVGKDLSVRVNVREVLAGKEVALGNLAERGMVTTRPTVTIAVAIRENGTLDGVILSALEPARLQEVVLTQIRPKEGELSLFDANGTLVYHSILEEPTWQQRVTWTQWDHLLKQALWSGRDRGGIQVVPLRGNGRWVCARVPIPGIGWVAGASRPVDAAFKEVREGLLTDALLGAAVFALAFLLAYLLGRSITGPLLRLEDDARLLGEGNLVSREDRLAPTEVRTLRETMLRMTTTLLCRSDALRESESSLRTIFENVYDGVAIHDSEGRFVEVNRSWLEMMRLTRDQAEGLTVMTISGIDTSVEELSSLWREVLAGETKFLEWRVRRPGDGTEFDCEVFLCSIRLRGEYMIMANVRDITERKRVAQELRQARDELEKRVQERTAELGQAFADLQEESAKRLAAVEELRHKEQLILQQSRLAAMGEMMGNIAHHWRQPLNIIGLMVQDLALSFEEQRLTPQEMQTQTDKVMAVIAHLSRSIDDFRNLFSPDSTRVRFNVRKMVEKGLSLLSAELQQVQVEVQVLCSDRECSVEGFRNEYLQVILNIVTNACDILRERHVPAPRIGITIFRDSGRSVVSIADNGGGIESGNLDKIFDPYFTTKGPESGTGIGLFMSKIIIEKNMAGTLSVRNTGEGAEFRIEV